MSNSVETATRLRCFPRRDHPLRHTEHGGERREALAVRRRLRTRPRARGRVLRVPAPRDTRARGAPNSPVFPAEQRDALTVVHEGGSASAAAARARVRRARGGDERVERSRVRGDVRLGLVVETQVSE